MGLFPLIAYLHLRQYINACTDETALLVEQDSKLKSRILLQIAQKTKVETKFAKYSQQLLETKEDKLSAAAVKFSFLHWYQEVMRLQEYCCGKH